MKNITSRLRTWLNNIPIQDPVYHQIASLLQVILLGFIAIIIISSILNLVIPPRTIPWQANLSRTFIFILILGIPLSLLRRGYFRSSILVIVAIFIILEAFAILNSNLGTIAETLSFFTLAIILAGLMVSRTALMFTFALSAGMVLFGVARQPDLELRADELIVAINFILLNGLIGLIVSQFGATFRKTLAASLEREHELKNEISIRKQIQAALQRSTERLELLHEIDRSLITARPNREIAKDALSRIRVLIPCKRASATLFDFNKAEATFLNADFDEPITIPDTPIPLTEFGLSVIEVLKQNKPWFTNDMLKEAEVTSLDERLANEGGVHSWLSLPLQYQGQLIGALNLGRGLGESFTVEEAETAQDIANQLAIAIQQSRLHEALQAELIERENLIAQLEDNNAELERFTYTVSHDLRNPLVTIKGFLGMLDKDIRESRHDRIQSDFQRIASATDKMDTLLTDLLELSRIGRIVNPPIEIDTVRLIQDALDNLDGRIRPKNITMQIATDIPNLYGDRTRLREVFENLIENAVKYIGDQPNPVIEIGTRQEKNEQVIFVKDNGIGIEARYQIRVFALFEKLNPNIEGTGIGLALVKRIVEVHGGRVWVESEGPEKGSTFCFTIPNSGE